MVIKWSYFAKTNLQNFIQNSKLTSPNNYVENLINSVYLLESHPEAGKLLFLSNSIEIRQLVYKMHRIVYKLCDNEIHIAAVLNSSQNLKSSLNFIKKYFI